MPGQVEAKQAAEMVAERTSAKEAKRAAKDKLKVAEKRQAGNPSRLLIFALLLVA